MREWGSELAKVCMYMGVCWYVPVCVFTEGRDRELNVQVTVEKIHAVWFMGQAWDYEWSCYAIQIYWKCECNYFTVEIPYLLKRTDSELHGICGADCQCVWCGEDELVNSNERNLWSANKGTVADECISKNESLTDWSFSHTAISQRQSRSGNRDDLIGWVQPLWMDRAKEIFPECKCLTNLKGKI